MSQRWLKPDSSTHKQVRHIMQALRSGTISLTIVKVTYGRLGAFYMKL